MRIALISDIHANRIALDAALREISAQHVDRIICLGDVATTGPQPRQVVEELRARNIACVMGNGDSFLAGESVEAPSVEDARKVVDIAEWCRDQISSSDLDFIRAFQKTIRVELGAGALLLCFHGTPRSNTEIIRATTPDAEFEEKLGERAAVMAGGHTHTQMLRRYKTSLIINPGSIGLPFEFLAPEGKDRNPPWAEYAVVNWQDGTLDIDFRRVPYDTAPLFQAARSCGMPHAEWWLSDWG